MSPYRAGARPGRSARAANVLEHRGHDPGSPDAFSINGIA
jgi:hypothetical protein